MTNEQFSNNFSTLLNSYGSAAPFGATDSGREIVLDEYEKSVFLTMAQDIIVKSYFDARLNAQAQGFDDSTLRQVDFSSLIRVAEISPEDSPSITKLDDRGIIFEMPHRESGNGDDILFILNEMLLRMQSSTINAKYVIKPISYPEYSRELSKPYGKPLKRQAWRLFNNGDDNSFDIMSEIIPHEAAGDGEVWKYKVRYVKRPCPIILIDLPDGLTIDGEDEETECELSPVMHNDILMKAVELAYMSRTGGNNSNNSQDNRQ